MEHNKFKVIVVDDEKLIAKNVAMNIKRAHDMFEVISIAYDGLEALEQVKELLPDVVFTDIKMPVMSGLELVARINEEYPSIKTVIVSGYDDFKLARTALEHNVKNYLLKPINSDEVTRTLQKLERTLLAEKNEISTEQNVRPSDIIENIKTYIKHNFDKPISFTEIANQYNFSQAYLTKMFKEQTGILPKKYLNDYRINHARKLLVDSNISIKDIALRVGFEDQFHFSKNFKNTVGVSPHQFRTNNRGMNPGT